MPNLHPVLVHYPIALLSVSLFFAIVAHITGKDGVSRAAWWMQVTGTLGLAITVLTGILAQHSVTIASGARDTFDAHQQLAFLTSILFALLLYWGIVSRTKHPRRYPALYLLLFFLAVCTLLIGGWFGGELVYRFGTGVAAGGR